MPTLVSGTSTDFTPASAGTHQGVCVDVIDHGMVDTQWGTKRKVSVRWQIDELMPGGKRFLVSKRYTASLNERAVLRHDLETWRGRAFTDAELASFDLDTVIGANALLSVVHNQKDGKTWANVTGVMALPRQMQKMNPLDYVRDKDRAKDGEKPAGDPETERQYEDEPPF